MYKVNILLLSSQLDNIYLLGVMWNIHLHLPITKTEYYEFKV